LFIVLHLRERATGTRFLHGFVENAKWKNGISTHARRYLRVASRWVIKASFRRQDEINGYSFLVY
jgi:hypothetical protein